MEETQQKIQWHSYFAQVMEKVCTRRNLLVEREQEVGKMPLRIDLIVIRKQDIQYSDLKIPYSYFNDINVLEFKSNTDVFDWNDLYQLEFYGRLYGILKNIEERSKISLWSVSSHFTDKYRNNLLEGKAVLNKIDDGFFTGNISGFDYYEMNVTELPLTKEYYPFHLFSKDKDKVKKLIELSIEHPEDARDYCDEMVYLHSKTYKEVCLMKLLNPLEAGYDEEGLKELFLEEPFASILLPKWKDEIIAKLGEDEIINKLGKDKIINKLGEDEIINKLGEDKIINKLGEDKITKFLMKKLGKKKMQELLDKYDKE